MSGDMKIDIFAEMSYGKAALLKMGPVPENFRLYRAAWMGPKPLESDTMEVAGAEFRAAKSGPNKGKLTIRVPGSERVVYVNIAEMRAAESVESTELPEDDTPDGRRSQADPTP